MYNLAPASLLYRISHLIFVECISPQLTITYNGACVLLLHNVSDAEEEMQGF